MQLDVLRSRSRLGREADGLLSGVFSCTEHEYGEAFLFPKCMKVSSREQSWGVLTRD